MIPIFDQSVYEWGLECIRFVQLSENAFLTVLMLAISFLSDPIAYLIALPVLFWCIDEKKGMQLGMLVLFSGSLNSGIKNFLQIPRPYIIDASVGLDVVHGFSTPSGHAQGSASFWPYAVHLFGRNFCASKKGEKKCICRKIAMFLLAIGMPLIIGFTRVYLGVHYPSDVLLGWTIGFLLSLGAILFVPKIILLLNLLPKAFKILVLALAVFFLNWIGPDDTSMAAAFFGLGFGYIFLHEKGGFDARTGTVIHKIIRILLGLAVIGFLYGGLKLIFPGDESSYYQLFRFTRYALVGFFASFVMPKVFIALKIALPTSSKK